MKSNTLENSTRIVIIKELEEINEGWKFSTMISLGASKKLKMNTFMLWYKWVDKTNTNFYL